MKHVRKSTWDCVHVGFLRTFMTAVLVRERIDKCDEDDFVLLKVRDHVGKITLCFIESQP